jgi:protein O-mannosyl-transferase
VAKRERILLAAIALGCVVPHLPLRHTPFIQDDRLAVESNPIVERGDLREIFSTTYWEGVDGADTTLYRPTAIASYALERRLVGHPDAGVAHGLNIVLHLAATLALFVLVRRLGGTVLVAGLSALLFSVHPIHVEAVAGIVGRAEILAAGLSFAALALGARALEARGSAAVRRACAWATAFLVFLALGAKEVALATPLLLLVLAALTPAARGESWSVRIVDRLGACAPSGLAVLAYLVLRIDAIGAVAALQEVHPFDNPLAALGGAERLASGLALVPRYAALLVAPIHLTADYAGPVVPVETTLVALRPLAGVAILLSLVGLALLPAVRSTVFTRLAAFASLLFLLPYAIVGNLWFDIGAAIAERLAYMPSAGACVLCALVLGLPIERAGRVRRVAMAVAALVVVALAARTWTRCGDWRDEQTLFRAATRVHAASPRAQLILGRDAAKKGDPTAALAALDQALAAYPQLVAAWLERGSVLGQLGRIEEARDAFARAVEFGPQHPAGHLNLGIAESRLGHADAARRSLRKALVLDPTLDKAWAQLGNLALARGDRDEAARDYRRAIALGRRDLEPRLAEALARP